MSVPKEPNTPDPNIPKSEVPKNAEEKAKADAAEQKPKADAQVTETKAAEQKPLEAKQAEQIKGEPKPGDINATAQMPGTNAVVKPEVKPETKKEEAPKPVEANVAEQTKKTTVSTAPPPVPPVPTTGLAATLKPLQNLGNLVPPALVITAAPVKDKKSVEGPTSATDTTKVQAIPAITPQVATAANKSETKEAVENMENVESKVTADPTVVKQQPTPVSADTSAVKQQSTPTPVVEKTAAPVVENKAAAAEKMEPVKAVEVSPHIKLLDELEKEVKAGIENAFKINERVRGDLEKDDFTDSVEKLFALKSEYASVKRIKYLTDVQSYINEMRKSKNVSDNPKQAMEMFGKIRENVENINKTSNEWITKRDKYPNKGTQTYPEYDRSDQRVVALSFYSPAFRIEPLNQDVKSHAEETLGRISMLESSIKILQEKFRKNVENYKEFDNSTYHNLTTSSESNIEALEKDRLYLVELREYLNKNVLDKKVSKETANENMAQISPHIKNLDQMGSNIARHNDGLDSWINKVAVAIPKSTSSDYNRKIYLQEHVSPGVYGYKSTVESSGNKLKRSEMQNSVDNTVRHLNYNIEGIKKLTSKEEFEKMKIPDYGETIKNLKTNAASIGGKEKKLNYLDVVAKDDVITAAYDRDMKALQEASAAYEPIYERLATQRIEENKKFLELDAIKAAAGEMKRIVEDKNSKLSESSRKYLEKDANTLEAYCREFEGSSSKILWLSDNEKANHAIILDQAKKLPGSLAKLTGEVKQGGELEYAGGLIEYRPHPGKGYEGIKDELLKVLSPEEVQKRKDTKAATEFFDTSIESEIERLKEIESRLNKDYARKYIRVNSHKNSIDNVRKNIKYLRDINAVYSGIKDNPDLLIQYHGMVKGGVLNLSYQNKTFIDSIKKYDKELTWKISESQQYKLFRPESEKKALIEQINTSDTKYAYVANSDKPAPAYNSLVEALKSSPNSGNIPKDDSGIKARIEQTRKEERIKDIQSDAARISKKMAYANELLGKVPNQHALDNNKISSAKQFSPEREDWSEGNKTYQGQGRYFARLQYDVSDNDDLSIHEENILTVEPELDRWIKEVERMRDNDELGKISQSKILQKKFPNYTGDIDQKTTLQQAKAPGMTAVKTEGKAAVEAGSKATVEAESKVAVEAESKPSSEAEKSVVKPTDISAPASVASQQSGSTINVVQAPEPVKAVPNTAVQPDKPIEAVDQNPTVTVEPTVSVPPKTAVEDTSKVQAAVNTPVDQPTVNETKNVAVQNLGNQNVAQTNIENKANEKPLSSTSSTPTEVAGTTQVNVAGVSQPNVISPTQTNVTNPTIVSVASPTPMKVAGAKDDASVSTTTPTEVAGTKEVKPTETPQPNVVGPTQMNVAGSIQPNVTTPTQETVVPVSTPPVLDKKVSEPPVPVVPLEAANTLKPTQAAVTPQVAGKTTLEKVEAELLEIKDLFDKATKIQGNLNERYTQYMNNSAISDNDKKTISGLFNGMNLYVHRSNAERWSDMVAASKISKKTEKEYEIELNRLSLLLPELKTEIEKEISNYERDLEKAFTEAENKLKAEREAEAKMELDNKVAVSEAQQAETKQDATSSPAKVTQTPNQEPGTTTAPVANATTEANATQGKQIHLVSSQTPTPTPEEQQQKMAQQKGQPENQPAVQKNEPVQTESLVVGTESAEKKPQANETPTKQATTTTPSVTQTTAQKPTTTPTTTTTVPEKGALDQTPESPAVNQSQTLTPTSPVVPDAAKERKRDTSISGQGSDQSENQNDLSNKLGQLGTTFQAGLTTGDALPPSPTRQEVTAKRAEMMHHYRDYRALDQESKAATEQLFLKTSCESLADFQVIVNVSLDALLERTQKPEGGKELRTHLEEIGLPVNDEIVADWKKQAESGTLVIELKDKSGNPRVPAETIMEKFNDNSKSIEATVSATSDTVEAYLIKQKAVALTKSFTMEAPCGGAQALGVYERAKMLGYEGKALDQLLHEDDKKAIKNDSKLQERFEKLQAYTVDGLRKAVGEANQIAGGKRRLEDDDLPPPPTASVKFRTGPP